MPVPSTIGASDPASPGVDGNGESVAGGINPETGDLTESSDDVSIPTFGPDLSFSRTYDSLLAQQQTATDKPSPMGYGWSASYLSSSLSLDRPNPGYLYRVAGPSGTGSGSTGDGGAATSALFNGPYSVATDSQGDVFIADSGNNRVRMIAAGASTPLVPSTTAGDVYTIAGPGSGSTSGDCASGSSATTACLNDPTGMAVDATGDVFIADTGNNRIEMVAAGTSSPFVSGATTPGDIYTVAGSVTGASGSPTSGTVATSAKLYGPTGVALASNKSLFIADRLNNMVEMVDATDSTSVFVSGTVTPDDIYIVAGTGAYGYSGDKGLAASAELNAPSGVAIDPTGNLYISDEDNARVQEVAEGWDTQWGIAMSQKRIYTVAGSPVGGNGNSGDGGPATSAFLSVNFGITIDSSGNLYITDTGNNEIQEVPWSDGTQWSTSMTAGNIYTVAGSASATSGNSGGHPATSGLMDLPTGVAIDPWGDFFIAQEANNKVSEVPASAASPIPVTPTGDGITVNDDSGAQTTFYPVPAASAITAASTSGGIATLTSSSTVNFGPGSKVTVSGMGNSAYNGTFTVLSTTQFTFSYALSGSPGSSSGGTASGCDGSDVGPNTSVGTFCTLPENDASLTYNSSSSQYTYSDNSKTGRTFDSTGKLLSESDLAGDTLTMAYGAPSPGSGSCPSTASSCDTATSASGRKIVFGLNASGLVTTASDPMNRTWTYAYNSSNQLTSATDPLGNKTSYAYGSNSPTNLLFANNLLTVTNPNGQSGGPDVGKKEVDAYDNRGRVKTQTDPMGNLTSISYTNMNMSTGTGVTAVTDPDGFVTDYDYTQGAAAAQTNWNSSPITGGSFYSGTETITLGSPAIPPTVGATVMISGAAPSTYNGTVTVTSSTATTFSYARSTSAGTYTSGGAVSTPSETDYGPDLGAATGTLLDTWTGDPDGNITTDSYDGNGNVTSETDPLGNTTTNTYDSGTDGQRCSSTALASESCSSASPPAVVSPGNTITVPSAPPKGLTYSLLDSDGNTLYTTTGVYEPGSSSASYSQTEYTLYNGNKVTIKGTLDQCTNTAPSQTLACATIDADGNVSQLSYFATTGDLYSSSTRDGNGSEMATTTDTAYDGDGELLTEVSPDGNVSGANVGDYTTTTTYDADGNTLTTTVGGGTGHSVTPRTETYTYDADGNQITDKNARGFTTTDTYDANDNQVLETDPVGNATLTCYDGDGNQAETVPPTGVSANSLSASSCPTSYPSSYGDRLATDATTYSYDAAGNQIVTTTPAPVGHSGSETSVDFYDPAGNQVESATPPTSNGGHNSVVYDAYDASANLTSETAGCTENVTEATCLSTSSPSITSYCYDPDGNQTARVPGDGNTSGVPSCGPSSPWTTSSPYQTTSSYDSADEEVSTTAPATTAAPSGITTSMTYDPAENVLTSTDQIGTVTVYGYAPLGEVASVHYIGSLTAHSVTYSYDADGNRVQMVDGTGTSGYSYDPFGEMTASENGAGQTTSYSYDADGNTQSITYPLPLSAMWATGDSVNYTYNNADVLTKVTDFNGNAITVANTADGLPNSLTLGSSGDTITTSYDNTDSPYSINLKQGSSTLLGFSYSGAPSGDILSESDTGGASGSPAYTYDTQGRVSSMSTASGTSVYAQDASSDLTSLPSVPGTPSAIASYDSASELTTSVAGSNSTTYSYDADGRRATQSSGGVAMATATWNGDNELSTYSDPSNANSPVTMTTVGYNGDGARTSEVSKYTATSPELVQSENFVWDARSVDTLLMNSDLAFVYGPRNTPVEQVGLSDGSVDYLAHDRLGSVRGLVQGTGGLLASTWYDVWGSPRTDPTNGNGISYGGLTQYTPLGYAGQYTDPSSLIYLLNRYFDPNTGQFVSVDPLVAETGQPYSYTNGQPVDLSDPTGLMPYGRPGGCGLPASSKTIWTYCSHKHHLQAWIGHKHSSSRGQYIALHVQNAMGKHEYCNFHIFFCGGGPSDDGSPFVRWAFRETRSGAWRGEQWAATSQAERDIAPYLAADMQEVIRGTDPNAPSIVHSLEHASRGETSLAGVLGRLTHAGNPNTPPCQIAMG